MLEYNRQIVKAKKEGVDIAKMPPPPKNEVDLRVACPHCTRKFDTNVAERHIPHCKDATLRRQHASVGRGAAGGGAAGRAAGGGGGKR